MKLIEELNHEHYKTIIYRRIQVAAAVFVIRTTPKDKVPEVYANELQQKLKSLWLNTVLAHRTGEISTALDQYILTQQQDILSKRLCSVISTSLDEDLRDHRIPCCKIGNQQNSSYGWSESSPDSFKTVGKRLHANAVFIQAVVQVKALAVARVTVPMDRYIGSVSRLHDWKGILRKHVKEPQPDLISSSEDSGYNAVDDSKLNLDRKLQAESLSPNPGVASSMLLYIINSCNADQLLVKSIQAILGQLKILACAKGTNLSAWNLNETINEWMGSIYHQSLEAVRFIADVHGPNPEKTNGGIYHCFSFLQEMIADIGSYVLNKDDYYLKEDQIVLIFKLCEGTSLCSPATDHIFLKLEDLMISMRDKFLITFQTAAESCYISNSSTVHNFIHDMEQFFFITRLVEIFLAGTCQYMTSLLNKSREETSNIEQERNNSNTITDLWKKHHNVQNKHPVTSSNLEDRITKAKSDIKHWKQLLDNYVNQILSDYPLVAVMFTECSYVLYNTTLQ